MAKLAINGGPAEAAELASHVPQNPQATERDKKAMVEVLDSGYWCRVEAARANRSRLDEFEQKFAAFQDAKHGVSASNGTVALQLALRTLGVGLYDEVIVNANAFIASVSSVTEVSAVPVLVDCDPATGNIDPAEFEKAITERTKAVIVVHQNGYPADMDRILPIAKSHGISVLEDAATCVGSAWRGRRVGAFGDVGTFSFQQRKILTAGEGGMLVTDDEAKATRAKLIHNIGRVVGRPGYIYDTLSSNYRMTEFQAALLLSRMQDLPGMIETRHENGEYFLDKVEKIGGIDVQRRDPRVYHNYYSAMMMYEPEEFGGLPKERFLAAMNAEGIPFGTGYGRPVYKQPAFLQQNLMAAYPNMKLPEYSNLRFPHAEDVTAREFGLPHWWFSLDKGAVDTIVASIEKVKTNIDEIKATPILKG